ncbi:MAG: S9 family peptidase [Flavobacteriales bacterium]|jgi:acylaminoacyl-peptidase|nr:S9 family peptidase [Flavobacteriales bacterium]
MHLPIRTALAGGFLACTLALAAQQKPFTYHDMLMLDRIGGLSVDPAGDRALFSVRSTDMANNKGVGSLYLKDLKRPAAPEVRLAVGDSGASSARWMPDGSGIVFLSARRGGTMQLFRSDVHGGPVEQLTRLPLSVQAYRLMPDGSGAVVALAVFPDAPGDAVAATAQRLADKPADSGQLYDRLFVRHWDTWTDGTRNHLYHVAFASGKLTPLTPGLDGDVPSKPFGGEDDFTIAPDGRTVYFSVRIAGKTEPWSTNFDIYSVPVTGGAHTNLTAANPAWDAHPQLSPDGKRLAYVAMERPGFEADRFALHVRDLATGRTTAIAPDWDRSVGAFQWARDGRSILVTAQDLGRRRLFRIDTQKHTVSQLSNDGSIDAFVETPRGIVFLKSGLNSPSQLFAARPKAQRIDDGATLLTGINKVLEQRAFGAYEQFSFPGWNDATVHGFVIKPANYVEGRKYPVAFLVHGGPQGSFGDGWSFRWNPQTYAGAGYAVVMIDFHGSTGYGQAFTDAISRHWGDRPLEDLQKGWAHALRTYPFLDGDRAAALGASYGGYMVNWIAGVWPQPWKALVSHCGVFDTRSMGYSTEELWFSDWENGASVFKDPAVHDTFNPLLHAHEWRVPMLVVHNDNDLRVPMDQGIGAFTALQANNVPSKMLRFPDENHWVLKPRNSKRWHDEVFGWLDRWIGEGTGE